MEHFDSYLELVDNDSSLLDDIPVLVPTLVQNDISADLLWYMGQHPKGGDEPENTFSGLPDLPSEPHTSGHATDIEWLLDTDSRHASTQTEPVDSLVGRCDFEHDSEDPAEDRIEEGLTSFPNAVNHCYRVRATTEVKKASPALQALMDLSNVEIAQAQE